MADEAVYAKIIEKLFLDRYARGMTEIPFKREDIATAAKELNLPVPKNLGDVVYSYRYRRDLPVAVRKKAPKGRDWIIRGDGRSRYRFVLVEQASITPNAILAETKIPDSTPGLIEKYALDDEQALLAKLRYNRLIDVFTGVTCYSLQNHLRTAVPGGQLETDEVYIGVDRKGAHYVFPVQAKGGRDRLSVVQIEQDFAMCRKKFPDLVCRPVAAQFMAQDIIALFEFVQTDGNVAVASEKHYRLVPPDGVGPEELKRYLRGPE